MWQYSFIRHVCVLKFNLIQFMSGQVLNEGVYNENYKKIDDTEKFFNSLDLLFQLRSTNLKPNISCNYEAKMATLSSTKLWTIEGFKKFKYCVENVHAKRRPKGNDKLELIREVFELSNQYLQDEYNMFQVHTWQLISSLIQMMLPISGTYTFKTWKTQTKNLGNVTMKHYKIGRCRSTEIQKRMRAEPRVLQELQEVTREF